MAKWRQRGYKGWKKLTKKQVQKAKDMAKHVNDSLSWHKKRFEELDKERNMGQITITIAGSFKTKGTKAFSAMRHGHAQATADAIRYLSEEILPVAIANDHECHEEGIKPDEGFGDSGGK